MLTSYHRFSTC
ncbi:hypothetical protein F383_24190 [Gossypium arboreum]|uniref:Uncharacterized protein n=1 Tax=Gossypium arboreum TaxID=29729 RepID=A0A0B0MK90_GOSAR|nr:hypothetical protein F383_24190 [Gossypium arboreum]